MDGAGDALAPVGLVGDGRARCGLAEWEFLEVDQCGVANQLAIDSIDVPDTPGVAIGTLADLVVPVLFVFGCKCLTRTHVASDAVELHAAVFDKALDLVLGERRKLDSQRRADLDSHWLTQHSIASFIVVSRYFALLERK